jgi:Rieske Fe-S protein
MNEQQAVPARRSCPSRRALLAAIGAAGLAALGGCATDSPQDDPGDADGRPASVPPSAAPSTTGQEVLTSTTAIPVGGGKVVTGILVVQPEPGLFKAFDARCPHYGALISPPQTGVITCYEHGSTFRDVDGALLGGPAPRGLKEISIAVDGTLIRKK